MMVTMGWEMTRRLKVKYFLDAIPDSDGIKSVICQRVGCSIQSLNGWLRKHPTLQAAYDTEVSHTLGYVHSLLLDNIELAQEQQEATGQPVDSQDMRWYLSKKGRDQGFGNDAPTQTQQVTVVSLSAWKKQAKSRLSQVEDMEDDE
jgi:hypothetical protein